MGAFRFIRQFDQKGGDNMISIGIDVHKKNCVATIKKDTRKKLEQSSFENTTHGIMGFIKHIKKTYGKTYRQCVNQLPTIGLDCMTH